MPPIIHLIRHGHGYHNIEPESISRNIHDPDLTPHGRDQCLSFQAALPPDLVDKVELVCASPMKRTLQTALLSLRPVLERRRLQVLALPDAQEVNDDPSNKGSSLEALRLAFEHDGAEFQRQVDWSEVERHPYWYRKIGRFDCAPREVVEARATRFRNWLRARPEKEIVVVGHGVFWHYVTGNIDERGEQTGPYWLNLMWRTFEFVDEQHDDAPICETSASKTRMETTFAMR